MGKRWFDVRTTAHWRVADVDLKALVSSDHGDGFLGSAVEEVPCMAARSSSARTCQ